MNLCSCKQHDGTTIPFALLRAWEGSRPGEAETGLQAHQDQIQNRPPGHPDRAVLPFQDNST
jgi:hypothetical protein